MVVNSGRYLTPGNRPVWFYGAISDFYLSSQHFVALIAMAAASIRLFPSVNSLVFLKGFH